MKIETKGKAGRFKLTTNTVCPWCDTEIIWDEELGPEDECPYCNNSLRDYGTLQIDLDPAEKPDKAHTAEDKHDEHSHEDEERGWSNFQWEDDGILYDSPEAIKVQEGLDKLLHEQEEVPECPQCREYMVFVGKEQLKEHFTPHLIGGEALLHAPVQLNVYTCMSCYQVSKFLDVQGRKQLNDSIQRLSKFE